MRTTTTGRRPVPVDLAASGWTLYEPPAPRREPRITYDVRTRLWTLQDADHVHYDEARGVAIVVPAGFRTDLASVPRVFWRWTAPHELGIASVLVHDLLYQRGGHVSGYVYSRAEADALFRDIMTECGVPRWRRASAYRAVRWFGGGAWRAAREAAS